MVDALLVLGSAEIHFLELSSVISVSLYKDPLGCIEISNDIPNKRMKGTNELRSNVWREVFPQGLPLDPFYELRYFFHYGVSMCFQFSS